MPFNFRKHIVTIALGAALVVPAYALNSLNPQDVIKAGRIKAATETVAIAITPTPSYTERDSRTAATTATSTAAAYRGEGH